MSKRSSKICLISPTENLASRAKTLIARRKMDVRVEVAALEGAVSLAQSLLEQDDYLFISRRATREMLIKRLGAQVVNIPLEASDYIPAIQRLQNERGLIASFSYEEEISNDLGTICYLLNLNVQNYYFTDSSNCQAAVQQAVADGAVCGFGGVVAQHFAGLCNLPFFMVESSDVSILRALDSAQQLYESQQENARAQEQLQIRLERYQNILDYTHDAVIAIDKEGRITATNQIADQMLRPAKPPFTGRPIEEVLANTRLTNVLQTGEAEIGQIMNIHGTLVSTNRVPIRVGGQVKGVVATFQDIKTLQTTERNIRIKLHEKGLVAKYHFSDILGTSPAILEAKKLSTLFADSQLTVMLYGETGTGKEMFASALHNASPRRDKPFIKLNCSAIPPELFESELFGYEDGAFTGAKKGGKKGKFELANGGTIFLDEIADMPMGMQAKLLRVLQEQEIDRVGSTSVVKIDVRVIAATNKDLIQCIQDNTFRADLYYRLNVINILVPPLRERREDIADIAEHFLRQLNEQYSTEKYFSNEAICALQKKDWPGNVRELRNEVERMFAFSEERIGAEIVLRSKEPEEPAAPPTQAAPYVPIPLAERLQAVEKAAILEALTQNDFNFRKTAQDLGISRGTLYNKTIFYGITRPE